MQNFRSVRPILIGRVLILVAAIPAIFNVPAVASIAVPERANYNPPMGVSEDFVIQLGSGAVPFLIARLDSIAYRDDHPGIAHRLATIGFPDHRIAGALDRHVRHVLLRKGKLGSDGEMGICEAFRAIGELGGAPGVMLLRRWLASNSWPVERRIVPWVHDHHLSCAIHGLAMSPHPSAKSVLNSLLQSPPRADDPKGIRSTIIESIDGPRPNQRMPED